MFLWCSNPGQWETPHCIDRYFHVWYFWDTILSLIIFNWLDGLRDSRKTLFSFWEHFAEAWARLIGMKRKTVTVNTNLTSIATFHRLPVVPNTARNCRLSLHKTTLTTGGQPTTKIKWKLAWLHNEKSGFFISLYVVVSPVGSSEGNVTWTAHVLGYCWAHVNEPIFITGWKTILTEFTIHQRLEIGAAFSSEEPTVETMKWNKKWLFNMQ